ncbi:hypothetical protein ABEW20_07590 [Bacillus safensis]
MDQKLIVDLVEALKWPAFVLLVLFMFRKLIIQVVSERYLKFKMGDLEFILGQFLKKAKKTVSSSSENSPSVNNSSNNQIFYKNMEVNFPELVSKKDNMSISDTLVIAHDDPIKAINNIAENFRDDLYELINFYGKLTNLSYEGDTIHCLNVLKKNRVITEQTYAAALSFYNFFMMIDLESDSINRDFIESKVREYQVLSVDILTNIKNEMALKLKDLES